MRYLPLVSVRQHLPSLRKTWLNQGEPNGETVRPGLKKQASSSALLCAGGKKGRPTFTDLDYLKASLSIPPLLILVPCESLSCYSLPTAHELHTGIVVPLHYCIGLT